MHLIQAPNERRTCRGDSMASFCDKILYEGGHRLLVRGFSSSRDFISMTYSRGFSKVAGSSLRDASSRDSHLCPASSFNLTSDDRLVTFLLYSVRSTESSSSSFRYDKTGQDTLRAGDSSIVLKSLRDAILTERLKSSKDWTNLDLSAFTNGEFKYSFTVW